jgi:hypothetical protein
MHISAQERNEKSVKAKPKTEKKVTSSEVKSSYSSFKTMPLQQMKFNSSHEQTLKPTTSLNIDSTKLETMPERKYVFNSANPYAYDYNEQGAIASWRGGELTGSNAHTTMPGLLVNQNAEMSVTQQYGDITLQGGISANRFAFQRGLQTQYGINGSMTYTFNENLSMTMFGRYVSNSFYYSMAAFPFIGTSAYGSYVTLHNEKIGIDLGVKRQYDPFRHQWYTDPIVTPQFKINNKVKIGVEMGHFLGQGLYDITHKHQRGGPIIMPTDW